MCIYTYMYIGAHNPFIRTNTCISVGTRDKSENTPLPWALLSNSAWPESHQQHELHYDKGFDCDNLLEP